MADYHGGIKLTQRLRRVGYTSAFDILIGPHTTKACAVTRTHRDARGGIRDAPDRRRLCGRPGPRGSRGGCCAGCDAERQTSADQDFAQHQRNARSRPQTVQRAEPRDSSSEPMTAAALLTRITNALAVPRAKPGPERLAE